MVSEKKHQELPCSSQRRFQLVPQWTHHKTEQNPSTKLVVPLGKLFRKEQDAALSANTFLTNYMLTIEN